MCMTFCLIIKCILIFMQFYPHNVQGQKCHPFGGMALLHMLHRRWGLDKNAFTFTEILIAEAANAVQKTEMWNDAWKNIKLQKEVLWNTIFLADVWCGRVSSKLILLERAHTRPRACNPSTVTAVLTCCKNTNGPSRWLSMKISLCFHLVDRHEGPGLVYGLLLPLWPGHNGR